VSSLELGSVTVQARLGSTRLLYKIDSARLGYCTSSARTRLSSTRLGSFTGLPPAADFHLKDGRKEKEEKRREKRKRRKKKKTWVCRPTVQA
jgi:hypothetical protein